MQQRVEEQLEGSRGAQVVQQLQNVWFGQESLASIESLRRGAEDGSEQRPEGRHWYPGATPTHRGLGSNERCQHAAARRTWGTEGHT